MTKIKYIYTGAPSWVTLREKDASGKLTETEVPLRPGKIAELDPENPYVKSLIARNLLQRPLQHLMGHVAEAVSAPEPVAVAAETETEAETVFETVSEPNSKRRR
ncbi:MAG: hypothetical protein LBH03_01495 [Holophagales bacterium]|jgi:hypothetical protein|nr:hypothetical protein [Holophagales bacterium]